MFESMNIPALLIMLVLFRYSFYCDIQHMEYTKVNFSARKTMVNLSVSKMAF